MLHSEVRSGACSCRNKGLREPCVSMPFCAHVRLLAHVVMRCPNLHYLIIMLSCMSAPLAGLQWQCAPGRMTEEPSRSLVQPRMLVKSKGC